MLGVDSQNGSRGTVEPGTDPGVFGGQRWGAVRGPESRGGVWLGGANAPEAGLRGTGANWSRIGATLHGKDDGTEPRAGNALDHAIPTRYTRADVELLASVDEAHETLSGPATQKLFQRAFYDFGDRRHERLAQLSVAHLYRLRRSRIYRRRRVDYQETRPTAVAIVERRPPQPDGRPGYLRVDTVHQGDLDGTKGVYHINAVDEVAQWEVVGATAQISEAWLMPVLEAMLRQFPYGSEFINHTVAKLLNKLLVEQTKSRPRHSNDNGLAESKNGAVVRKHMGWGHIAAPHAEAITAFCMKVEGRWIASLPPSGSFFNEKMLWQACITQAEPGTGDAADRAVSRERDGERAGLSTAPVRPPVQASRHRAAGRRGRGA